MCKVSKLPSPYNHCNGSQVAYCYFKNFTLSNIIKTPSQNVLHSEKYLGPKFNIYVFELHMKFLLI